MSTDVSPHLDDRPPLHLSFASVAHIEHMEDMSEIENRTFEVIIASKILTDLNTRMLSEC